MKIHLRRNLIKIMVGDGTIGKLKEDDGDDGVGMDEREAAKGAGIRKIE